MKEQVLTVNIVSKYSVFLNEINEWSLIFLLLTFKVVNYNYFASLKCTHPFDIELLLILLKKVKSFEQFNVLIIAELVY